MTLFRRKFETSLVSLDWTSRLTFFLKNKLWAKKACHFAPSCAYHAVDLHGLHVAEALSMLANALQEFVHQGFS